MATPDPALGISVSFPSQEVRNAFLFAMQLGAPADPARQATFVKKGSGRSFYDASGTLLDPTTVRTDRDGLPLNPNIRVEYEADTPISADCAVTVERADADELPVGNFRPTKAVVTLMDVEYQKIAGCRELRYNGDRYVYGYEPEADGLFDLTIHTIIFYALDES